MVSNCEIKVTEIKSRSEREGWKESERESEREGERERERERKRERKRERERERERERKFCLRGFFYIVLLCRRFMSILL